MKLDLKNLFSQNSIIPKAIIHVGAYDGKDIKLYQTLNISKIFFIEANPTVFERLKANTTRSSVDVTVVNYAISNQNGKVTLYVNSMVQSSSILPLKHYRDIYPNIKETHQLIVESKTLDNLLEELELSPTDFNILNLDIQGAELLALQGATNLLKYIDVVYTKVNYEELYEGCALAEEIDEFLGQTGFGRVAIAKPFHPSWGNAFYVRKQVVTMSTLGKNGGFGNQIFQYAFLKIYAQENRLSVETPKWLGQELFGHKDREINQDLPVVFENNNEIFPGNGEIWKNVDIQGYFLYHTSYYRTHKEYFCSLFQPVAEIEALVKVAWEKLCSRGKTIIGLHLQLNSDENNNSVVASSEWYKIWLHGLWETLEEPVLFIASDHVEEINQGYFAEYNPITVRDLEVEVNLEYLNFFLLSKCDFVAISNTAFAFAACLLNETGKYFFRPHFSTAKLIPFEPWNSNPVFRDLDINEVGKSVSYEAQLEQIKSQLQQTQTKLENSQSQTDELSQKLASTHSQLQQTQTELENIQYQRDQILGELEQSHSQLQQNQEKAKNAESQLQETREELENTKSQKDELSQQLKSTLSQLQQNQEKAKNAESKLENIKTELDKSQSQLHDTQEELEITQFQLDEVQAELEQSQSQLPKHQEQLNTYESQLQQTQTELEKTKLKLENQEKMLPNKNQKNYPAHIKNLAKILAEIIPD